MPLFPIGQTINYNYISNFLEDYSCCQVTITITRIIPLQIIYVIISWTMVLSHAIVYPTFQNHVLGILFSWLLHTQGATRVRTRVRANIRARARARAREGAGKIRQTNLRNNPKGERESERERERDRFIHIIDR